MIRLAKKFGLAQRLAVALAGLPIIFFALFSGSVAGAHLSNRKLTLSNDSAGANTTYTISFGIATAGTLGSIDIMFCSNDPVIDDPCTVPAGLDVSGAVLSSQSGEVGFSISGASTANDLILTRAPSASIAQPATYQFDNVVNPSADGSYYVRIQTYATADASGASTDYGGIAYGITKSLLVSSYVPPYILFCAAVIVPAFSCGGASGSIVELGEISKSATTSGQSQMLVATNAANGYTIYMQGTSLTSGNDVITSLTIPSTTLSGTDQFGLNLRSNTSPPVGQDPAGPGSGTPTASYNQPNKFKFVSNDTIAASASAEDYRRYTISYIANAALGQPPGIYVSTITYVAVGNF